MIKKTYPKYKPSDITWLGRIPNHWKTYRLKYCADLVNEKVDGRNSDLPYTGLEHIESWTGKRIVVDGTTYSDGQANRYRKGDVLFGKLRPYLAKALRAVDDGICTGELLVLRPRCVIQDYLFNYVLTSDFISIVDSSTYGAKMPRANWEFVGNLPILVPPEDEQRAIAAFLDRETARIDALIKKKERQIELLQEKRAAVISYAVTKGLNPNVKMKDSGIEWLGDVPEHWHPIRLRYRARINPSRSELNGMPGDLEVSFVPMEAVHEYGGLTLSQTRPFAEVATGYTYFRDGDVLIAKITPCFENGKGSIAQDLVHGIGFGTTELHVLRPCPELDRRFLFYVTISHAFRHLGAAEMYGAGGQKRVPDDFIKDFRQPVPTLQEQRAIAAFLDRETARIDALIEKIRKSIDLLREYRTALITAAVTGKIDVRRKAQG